MLKARDAPDAEAAKAARVSKRAKFFIVVGNVAGQSESGSCLLNYLQSTTLGSLYGPGAFLASTRLFLVAARYAICADNQTRSPANLVYDSCSSNEPANQAEHLKCRTLLHMHNIP
jgi:hypothetical protein